MRFFGTEGFGIFPYKEYFHKISEESNYLLYPGFTVSVHGRKTHRHFDGGRRIVILFDDAQQPVLVHGPTVRAQRVLFRVAHCCELALMAIEPTIMDGGLKGGFVRFFVLVSLVLNFIVNAKAIYQSYYIVLQHEMNECVFG